MPRYLPRTASAASHRSQHASLSKSHSHKGGRNGSGACHDLTTGRQIVRVASGFILADDLPLGLSLQIELRGKTCARTVSSSVVWRDKSVSKLNPWPQGSLPFTSVGVLEQILLDEVRSCRYSTIHHPIWSVIRCRAAFHSQLPIQSPTFGFSMQWLIDLKRSVDW
jgi:hypothetical protein